MNRPQVGRAWCSPHDCPPLDCIDQHRLQSETAQKFLENLVPPGSQQSEIVERGRSEFSGQPEDQLPVCPHRKTRHFEIGGKSYFWCEGCNPFKGFGRG